MYHIHWYWSLHYPSPIWLADEFHLSKISWIWELPSFVCDTVVTKQWSQWYEVPTSIAACPIVSPIQRFCKFFLVSEQKTEPKAKWKQMTTNWQYLIWWGNARFKSYSPSKQTRSCVIYLRQYLSALYKKGFDFTGAQSLRSESFVPVYS